MSAVYLMVLHRSVDPGSKCAAFRFADDVYGAPFDRPELHDLYRSLDRLAEVKATMEASRFASHRDLFTDTDLLYFDTTSAYVERSRPEEPAAYGCSGDHRGERRQVGLGVVLTREGLPVAHVILPGNTADPAAFPVAIEYLRETLGVGRVMLCCDRGMMSEENLQALRNGGTPYLAATKLRRNKAAQAVPSQPGRYHVVTDNLEVKEVTLPDTAERYIVCRDPESVDGLLRGAARRYVRTQA